MKTRETELVSQTPSTVDRAGLLAASSPHSGDWLHAAPVVPIGLRLSDEATIIAVAHRLECRACATHVCVCGKTVDTRGLHFWLAAEVLPGNSDTAR